jgi:transcriptional regulatory protein RtcR
VLPEWSIASTSIEKILETLTVVVKTVDDPILILGDTGVGKTRLAKMIHDIHGGPFKAANCATIRGDTAKSELFGHARGAYTGSSGERKGLLLEANKGVLFLDEIGELGLEEQGMLLKAIEEGKFSPMGGDNLVKSTFGLVAGTNRNLDMAVLQGRFRRDLLARISVWKFRLPGLGESKEGIPTAINDALQEFCTNNKMERVVRFDVNAEKSFYEFAVSEEAIWPGNFRELRSSVRRMATMAQDGIISQDIIHQELGRLQSEWSIHQQNKREIKANNDHVPCSVENGNSQHANLLALIPDARSRWDQAELDYADQLITTCLQAKSQAQAARLFFPVKLKLMPVGEKKLNPTNMIVRELEKYDLSWKSLDPLRSVP